MHGRDPSTYSGNTSYYRCDQCASYKLSCNRALPFCSMCNHRNMKCTLKRKLKYCKRVVPNEHIIESKCEMKTIKFVTETSTNLHSEFVGTQMKRGYKSTNPNFKLFNIQAYMKTSKSAQNLFQSLLCQYSNKSNGYNLYCILSHPKKDKLCSRGLAFVGTTKSLNLVLSQKPVLPTIPVNFKVTEQVYFQVLAYSFQSYFNKINSLFYMFNSTNFFRRPRSKFLLYAVALAGLKTLDNDAVVSRLEAFLDYQLYIQFKLSYKVPTLDTIQAILVMLVGLNELRWKQPSCYLQLGFTNNLAAMLGLHLMYGQTPNSSWSPSKLERWLTYAVLMKSNALSGWISQVTTYTLIDDHFESNCNDIAKLPFTTYKSEEVPSLLLNYFFVATSSQFKTVALTQQLTIASTVSEFDLTQIVLRVVTRISCIRDTVIKHLKQMKNVLPATYYSVDCFINFIDFSANVGIYRVYSLPIHFPISRDLTKLNSNVSQLLALSLSSVHQLFLSSSKLPTNFYHYLHIPILCQALVYLLLQKSYCSDQTYVQSISKFAYANFNFLANHSVYRKLAKINLVVADIIYKESKLST